MIHRISILFILSIISCSSYAQIEKERDSLNLIDVVDSLFIDHDIRNYSLRLFSNFKVKQFKMNIYPDALILSEYVDHVTYWYNQNKSIIKSTFIYLFGITFSKKVFLTTFIQYNNQVDNLNINARIQWRYKPVSDLYLVFTDNYTTDRYLSVRNRAIVAKVTYWLNT